MDTQTQNLRERALLAYQERLKAEEAARRADEEAAQRQEREWLARHAVDSAQVVQRALGVEATPVPEFGMARADGLYFSGTTFDYPYATYCNPNWQLLVHAACRECGKPHKNGQEVSDLADLGRQLEAWLQHPPLCYTCQEQKAKTETLQAEPEPEPPVELEPTPEPGLESDPFGQLVDLLGAALQKRGWLP